MGPYLYDLAGTPALILGVGPDHIPVVGVTLEDLTATIAFDLNHSVLPVDHAFLLFGKGRFGHGRFTFAGLLRFFSRRISARSENCAPSPRTRVLMSWLACER